MFLKLFKNERNVYERLHPNIRHLAFSPFNKFTEKCSIENPPIVHPAFKLGHMPMENLRNAFLNFFKDSHGHPIVAPCSVYPKRGEDSYFINSGMNQFKSRILSGSTNFTTTKSTINADFYTLARAVNTQQCIRIGGKYNDLNDVGFDSTHLTAFEMAGNWSFGDYGKLRACQMMWQFLIETLKIPKEALYVTYFQGDNKRNLPVDLETRDIWLKIGVPDNRLMPFGVRDNYWRAGSNSGGNLCGPSTEIHLDVNSFKELLSGRTPACARCQINSESSVDGVVEIWNCVFIEKKSLDTNLDGKSMESIPLKVIDTGMGLERLYAVLNGTISIYETPKLTNYISSLSEDGKSLYSSRYPIPGQNVASDPNLQRDIASRIIIDHFRAISTVLYDGLLPGRQGLSLKIRQLIQRLTRSAVLGLPGHDESRQLQQNRLHSLVNKTFKEISLAHIEATCDLVERATVRGPNARTTQPVYNVDQQREILLSEMLSYLPKVDQVEGTFLTAIGKEKTLTDEKISKLLETKEFGSMLSLDSLEHLCKWHGLAIPSIDSRYDHARETITPVNPSESHNISQSTNDSFKYKTRRQNNGGRTYVEDLSCKPLLVLDSKGKPLEKHQPLVNGEIYQLITDYTNHYAQSGGQESDQGQVLTQEGNLLANVQSVSRDSSTGAIMHEIIWTSRDSTEMPKRVVLSIDQDRRWMLTMHHTGQHLFNYVLAKTMKDNLASSTWLTSINSRISTDHFINETPIPLSPTSGDNNLVDLVNRVESLCRDLIKNDYPLAIETISQADLMEDSTIIRYPDEDYHKHERLRLLRIGNADGARELCGGTHLESLKNLEDVIVTNITGTKTFVKVFRVMVGPEARKLRQQSEGILTEIERRHREFIGKSTPALDLDLDYVHLQGELEALLAHISQAECQELTYVCRQRLASLHSELLMQLNDFKAKGVTRNKTKVQLTSEFIESKIRDSNLNGIINDWPAKDIRFPHKYSDRVHETFNNHENYQVNYHIAEFAHSNAICYNVIFRRKPSEEALRDLIHQFSQC